MLNSLLDTTGLRNFNLQEAARSGKLVAEVTGLSFAYAEAPVVKNFSTTVMRGDRIGIIGPNGVGKTTLAAAWIAGAGRATAVPL